MEHFYISQIIKKKLSNNNLIIFNKLLLLFIVFLFTTLFINTVRAQQIIGVFPEINGSFSLQPNPLPRSNPFLAPQTNWSTQQLNKGVVKATGGRSNRKYLEFSQSSGATAKRLYTPTMGTKIKRNKVYTVQFYAKGDLDGTINNNQEIRVGISPNSTNNLNFTPWFYDNDTVYSDWELFTAHITTANIAEGDGLVVIEAENNRLIYIDDFVIYPDTLDVMPPNNPDTLFVDTTSLTTVNLSWPTPQGGLDSGGYMLVRYNNKPVYDDLPNYKGIYDTGDTIFGSNQGIIVYIGTDTSFFDSGLLSNSEYWYRLFAVDKAFNYSEGKDAVAYTLNVYPELQVVENIHDFGLIHVGNVSAEQSYTISGQHLLENIVITAPPSFKISTSSGSGFTSSITLTPTSGVVATTTIYVRFEPLVTGLITASILNKTFGTTNININVSGTGFKDAPTLQASHINCTDVGPRSMNVKWTNGNGDRRLVKMNTTNSFTDPIDNTYPASNPDYTGTGEQIVYKGSDTIFNVYGLSPLSQYWFRVYEFNNTDTLTKYLTATYTLNPNSCLSGKMTDFFEDFEMGVLDGYYADSIISLESGNWHFVKAAIGTQVDDKKRGGRSARIQKGGFIAMDFDKPQGIEKISIYHANYRQDLGGKFMVQYSTDHGHNFHSLGVVTCNSNGTMQKTSFDVYVQGPVRIVINAINGNRINIDDIAINDFILTTWTGYADTVWSNHNNWDFGVPDTYLNVLIPTIPQGNSHNFPVITSTNAHCNNITIDTGASLTINPNAALTVMGKVTALDTLIILSDETGSGSVITYGDFTGTAHVYKYIFGSNKSNYVSTPISDATALVFDAALSNNTLEYLNEPTALWTDITLNTTPLTPVMRGYDFKRPASGTVLFSGNLNNYNNNLNLTRTTSSPHKGFNLIGNPYPSGINWNSDSINTNSFSHKTYWTNNNETFATYNGNAKIGCPASINNIILPMQSFFVKLDTPLTSFNFVINNYAREHPTDTPDTSTFSPNIFRLMVNQQTQLTSDEIAIAFFNPATDTLDNYDSEKLFSLNSTVPQIYTRINNDSIAINSSTPITQYKEFPLGFKTKNSANFTFTPLLNDYDITLPVFLKDKLLDSLTDLRTVGNYSFSSTGIINDTNRFSIIFYPCYFTIYDFSYDSTYCEGSNGVNITLNGSESNVNYQLYINGAVIGSPMSGTGNPITWNNMLSGNYTVNALSTVTPACSIHFRDTAAVTQIPLPVNYTFETVAGNTYCQGSVGAAVQIVNSENDIQYQLLKNGTAYGSIITGTGSAIVWDSLLVGSYSLIAYTNTTPSCSRIFNDTITIAMIPSPATFDVTSVGTPCANAGGVITLHNSELGVNYQLKKGLADILYAYTGTGDSLQWSDIYVSGDYYIIATSTITGCSVPMNDTVNISYIAAPIAYNVIGGGTFCEGQGVIGLENSDTNVYYQLIRNSYYNIGSPIIGIGDTLHWTNLSAGFYSVKAHTLTIPQCNADMSGVKEVIGITSPTIYNLSTGGSYCNGQSGASVNLSGSQPGVKYQIFKNGSSFGSSVAGTGFSITWNSLLQGNYTVIATNLDSPFCSVGMNGTAVVTESPLPTVYSISGGGNFCTGGTGLGVTLGGSQSGVNYQLKKNGNDEGTALSGTGSALAWNNLSSGTYTVSATYAASPNCSANMSGSVIITESPAPTVFSLTGGGGYCTGGSGMSVTLSFSQSGVNYQLKKNGVDEGSVKSGTGSALAWNNLTSGTYTVVATYVASPNCSASMSGSVIITVSPLPTVFNLSGGGSYCVGGFGLSVTLSGSQSDINYQLYKNSVIEGSPVAGTGSSLTWNNLTSGTYTIVATYVTSPNCSSNMSGSVIISTSPAPTIFNLSGGGSYCASGAGLTVTLSSSQSGVNYQLKKNNVDEGSIVSGTGSALVWNNLTSGTYTIIATYVASPNCSATMNGSVIITESPAPTLYILTGGGSYCAGGSGLSDTLSGSQLGVNYQLKKNGTDEGGVISGTGSALIWSNLTFGTYTVVATYGASPYCSAPMNGSVVITENTAPTVFNISGSGTYCAGGTGLSVTLSGSQLGINYQLKKNNIDEGSVVSGTGSALVWNNLTLGTYTVIATYAASPHCSINMNGSVDISESPAPTVFNLTGGGSSCSGGLINDTLSGSQTGVNYQLKKNGTDEGSVVSGTGSALVWSNLSSGTYTVVATYVASPNCSIIMNGSVVIAGSPTPTVFDISGGGSYCVGGTGLSVTLSNSQVGFNYQLKKNNINEGNVVNGTGSALVWNNLTLGTYTVVATYTASPFCSATMNGSVVISESPAPTAYNLTGGGSYCAGGSGMLIMLSNSQVNVLYQLKKNGNNQGSALSGNGSSLMWSNQYVGTYTVVATYLTSPFCSATMNGSVIITSPAPTVFNLTGGGSYCNGGTGLSDTLSSSQTGVNYQLKKNGSNLGAPISGTGNSLVWNNLPAGTYTVVATLTTSPFCSATMNGSVIITESNAPTLFNLSGGGNYCTGGTGLSVTLNGSQSGVNYQLYKNSVIEGSSLVGTGTSLTWNSLISGTYTVVATYATSPYCAATMNGSVTINVSPVPTVFNLTGGGSYCTGGSGLSDTLSGSQTGVYYQLKKNGIDEGSMVSGSGNALAWNYLSSGTYTVVATYVASPYCSSIMNNSVTITESPLPTVFNLTGGGSYCSGGTGLSDTLSGSQIGVHYQLKKDGNDEGTIVNGTDNALVWNNLTAGTYTVVATYSSAPNCSANMTGSITITLSPNPTVFTLSGGGSYCASGSGLSVTLSGSQSGVNYQLYKNSVIEGSTVAGTGSSLTWSSLTAGTYTVVATYSAAPNCSANMTGSITITLSPNPTVFTLSGGGSYCASGSGLSVTLSGSQSGVNYQLYKNSVIEGSTVASTGSSLIWSSLTAGTYTVVATYSAAPNCSANMTGAIVISVSPSPTVFNLTGGGSYCTGGSGLSDTLSGSQVGVNYQLKKNGVDFGTALSGTGSSLVWNNLLFGTYTVVATYVASPNCSVNMNGSVTIIESPVPTVFNLTGNGSYCAGGSGLNITLSGSQLNVIYQLKKNGNNVGGLVSGTGNALVWSNLTYGTYTVVAGPLNCSATMNGSVIITENPAPTLFNLTGSGSYCTGGTGMSVTLSSSQSGVNYQLMKNGANQGTAISGTGNALVWNNMLFGTYTVVATYVASPYCSATMSGSVVITESPTPTLFNLTGGGSYCTGGAGMSDTLSSSQIGVNYQLKKNGVDLGTAIIGTGSALVWNNLVSGTYTVIATYAASPYCSATMNGSVTITLSPTPNVFNLTGGGSYCTGGSGLSITLNGSQSGVNYQLMKNSVIQGTALSGTGSALVWNNMSAGTYTVVASFVAYPYCSASMSGSVIITESPTPTVFNLTGSGYYCAGSTGLSVTLSGSQVGINYQLKKNNVNQGAAISGTGSVLVWNNLLSGTYTVVAAYAASPFCSANMNGLIVISQNPLPVVNAGVDQTIPNGSSTALSATASGGSGNYNFSWTPSALLVNPNAQSTNTHNINSITQFIVTVQDVSTNCINSDTMIIFLSGGPLSVLAIAQANTICEGDTAYLSALVSGGTGSYTYTWSSNPSGYNSNSAHPVALPSVNTTYTVSVFDGFNTQTSSIAIIISPLPDQLTLSGNGSYCQGSSGNNISLNNSYSDVLYQLYQNGSPFGSPVQGIDAPLTWPNITSGTYTAIGTFDYAPACSAHMLGTVTVTQSPNPTVFNVTGSGTFCQGGTGLSVSLSGSQTGINYQLLNNGNPSGSPVSGTGSPLTWANQTSGNYTVSAVYANSPFCTANMNGTAVISQSNSPTIFTLSGGGSYCAGGTGLSITLSGSQVGVNYQLKKNGNINGAAVSGTGNALVWNNLSGGTYTVVATYVVSPNCSANMTGSIVVTAVALPVVSLGNNYSIPYGTNTTLHAVVSGGSGSFSYQWQPASSVIAPNAANTNTVNLTSQTQFIVHVTDLVAPYCTNSDTIVISITGGPLSIIASASSDTICQGDTVFLHAVASGGSGSYSYSWSSNPAGFNAAVANTFAVPSVSTTYTVVVNDNYNIASSNKAIVVRQLPQSYNLSTGGYYCYGSTFSITLSGSQLNVNYQLYKNGSPYGALVSGTGNPLSWNNLLFGNYTVEAFLSSPPHCQKLMTGTAVVNQYQQTNIVFNAIPPLCADNNIHLLTATPTGGTFSGTGVSGNNFSAVTAGVGNHTITYSYSDVNSCIATAQQSALVNPLPSVSLNNLNDVCISDPPFPLYGGTPSGGYFQGNGISNDSLFPGVCGTGSHIVTYWYTDANSCKNSDVDTIQVNGFPVPYTLITNGFYCPGTNGTSITLSSSENGVSYQLYNDTTAYGPPVIGNGDSIVWNNIYPGQYHIWGYYSNTPDCKTFMNNIVSVNQAIPADVWLGEDTILCQNQYITLAVHVGYTYYWVKLPDDTLSYTNTLLIDSTVNGMGSQTYVVWLIDNHNCVNTDTINVFFDNCVYVVKNEDFNIMIYPNPSSDFINIDFMSMKNGDYKIEFVNMLGQAAFEKSINIQNNAYKLKTDISKFVKGVYQINIFNNNRIIVNKKFVVN